MPDQCDLERFTVRELLQFGAKVSGELRRRLIVRTANNPTGDYGEWLFSKAFGWTLEHNSRAGYDAIDSKHGRIQIKCRRITPANPSRMLSSIRNLNANPFDVLGGILLNEHYDVHRAALIPINVIAANATYNAHVNGHRFLLQDAVWSLPDVVDVTEQLRVAAEAQP